MSQKKNNKKPIILFNWASFLLGMGINCAIKLHLLRIEQWMKVHVNGYIWNIPDTWLTR